LLKIAIETENKMCEDTEQECEDDMSTHRLATALKRKIKVKTCTLLHLDTKHSNSRQSLSSMYTR